jgi:hypothetical protein
MPKFQEAMVDVDGVLADSPHERSAAYPARP